MSRTTLGLLTAAVLAGLSICMMICRFRVLGDEVKAPKGPGAWKVTLKVSGKTVGSDARLQTITPLDFGSQHVDREAFHSNEMLEKPPAARHPERRTVLWSQRAGTPEGPFRVFSEFYCNVDMQHPTASMASLAKTLAEAPSPGEKVESQPLVECDNPEISALARRLTADRPDPSDQVEALFNYVDQEIGKEPNIGGPGVGAVECLKNNSGDSAAKSRLLVALCRNRGIPARLVTGLRLCNAPDQVAHLWAEAWVHNHWMPMCPFNHHYGRVPSNYLVFGFGEFPIVHGHHVRDLDYAFLVERNAPDDTAAIDPWPLRRVLKQLSLYALPPPEQRLVEFLLLLPIAALIVCFFRHVIGLGSFGTFAPALIGLAFRDLHSLPGILIFVSIVLLGWGMRRVLNWYHLLQVPRTAFMLSLVVILLIVAVVTGNLQNPPLEATKYFSVFPMVILTSMIERFWTLEVEDGTTSSFRTLLGTIIIAGVIALVLGTRGVIDHMFRYPETLGLIMAAQLVIGRYTGYRLSELFRFRDFLHTSQNSGQWSVVNAQKVSGQWSTNH